MSRRLVARGDAPKGIGFNGWVNYGQKFAAQLLSASLGEAKAVKVEATQEHYLDGRSGAIQLAARAAPSTPREAADARFFGFSDGESGPGWNSGLKTTL